MLLACCFLYEEDVEEFATGAAGVLAVVGEELISFNSPLRYAMSVLVHSTAKFSSARFL